MQYSDNILAQSGVSGDKILSGANTVTVVDTSANIIAKLDQLEILAKAGKIADIKFTDTPTGALNITNEQLVKDAEAIGKIISQRALPTLVITKPNTPVLFSDSIYFCNFNAGYNDGTIILNGNAQIKNNEGKDGTDAIYFDGNNSSIILNNKNLNLDNKNFSLSFDCKPDPIQSPYSVIFSKMDYVRAGGYDPNSPKILVMGNNGKVWIDAFDNVQKDLKHIEFNNFNDNQWHNINILRSNNIISVKCDNILVGQFDVDPNYRFNLTGIQFGSHQDSNGPQGTFFRGYIDNILVTNVDATMPTTVPPPTVNTNNIPSITNNNKPTFTGTAVGNSTITLYNNGNNLPWATVQSDAGGYWSYTPSNPISDGNYSITAKASNATGIQSAASPAFIFRVDTVPPSAPTLTGPIGTIDNNKPVFSGTAEPNTTILVLEGSFELGRVIADSRGDWKFTCLSSLKSGSHEIKAVSIDTAGNTSAISNLANFNLEYKIDNGLVGATPPTYISANAQIITIFENNIYYIYKNNNGTYTKINELISWGGATNIRDISDDGSAVCGWASSSGPYHSFVSRLGNNNYSLMNDLHVNGKSSQAFYISPDSNIVAGMTYDDYGEYHIATYKPFISIFDNGTNSYNTKILGKIIDPDNRLPSSGISSMTYNSNNVYIVGQFNFYNGNRAFLSILNQSGQVGNIYDLGTLGGFESSANAISDNGKSIIGYSKKPDPSNGWNYDRAFIVRMDNNNLPQTMLDLGTLGGRSSVAAIVSPDGNSVAGKSDISINNSISHAFLWRDNNMIDLELKLSVGQTNFNPLKFTEDSRGVIGTVKMNDGFHIVTINL